MNERIAVRFEGQKSSPIGKEFQDKLSQSQTLRIHLHPVLLDELNLSAGGESQLSGNKLMLDLDGAKVDELTVPSIRQK